jgi:peptide-methionine (R)-S-oxide reductase
MKRRLASLAVVAASTALFSAYGLAGDDDSEKLDPDEPTQKVVKTDEEWAKLLTKAQFMVCRMKATEPAFSGKYVHTKVKGTFACVCCGAKLFSTKAKFESGTGWPSFWRPYADKSIETAQDLSDGQLRIEVMCSRCGGHLGHVFNDGPPPTGLRFCINSVALKLVPDSAAKPAAKDTKSKPSSKAKGDSAGKEQPGNKKSSDEGKPENKSQSPN